MRRLYTAEKSYFDHWFGNNVCGYIVLRKLSCRPLHSWTNCIIRGHMRPRLGVERWEIPLSVNKCVPSLGQPLILARGSIGPHFREVLAGHVSFTEQLELYTFPLFSSRNRMYMMRCRFESAWILRLFAWLYMKRYGTPQFPPHLII